MIFAVYSETNSETIKANFGFPEYSYYFVLKEFLPLFQRLGTVIVVTDPMREVDEIYRRAAQQGEDCIFFSFSPPHRTPLGLACPTVPVFAWEFDKIPSETWFNEQFQDWRFVLNKLGRAITHSSFSVQAVHEALGHDFPIVSIPAPVWDKFSALRQAAGEDPVVQGVEISPDAPAIDSRAVDWTAYAQAQQERQASGATKTPRPIPGIATDTTLQIDGVVYTSIFSSHDLRKNYFDMLDAFCWAMRGIDDATLILKIGHKDSSPVIDMLMQHLGRLAPFKCRVVLIDGYLNNADYESLLRHSTYAVNTSIGEGQCLPLMEYMAYGKPAIAPRHSGMIDYVSAESAFVINSTAAPGIWAHDDRMAFRTFSQRIDFESLLKAYEESYRVAKTAPARYRAMAENARRALEQHCSLAVAHERLKAFLALAPRAESSANDYGALRSRDISYQLESTINFANKFETRRYLFGGWSKFESAYGIWTVGPVAELAFRIDPKPAKPLKFCISLTPFINSAHPQMSVGVSVNGVAVARWNFSVDRPEDVNQSWRYATFPADAISGSEIRVKLWIENPASPELLGLSNDDRLLGVTLHELAIVPLDSDSEP